MLLLRLRLAFWKFNVVITEEMRYHHFHLATGKETSRTGPNTMTEVDVVGPCGDMLVFELAAGDLGITRGPC
jgi:hypothetical protein